MSPPRCEYTEAPIDNRKTDPQEYFKQNFETEYNDCTEEKCKEILNNLFVENNKMRIPIKTYKEELETIKKSIDDNETAQLVTKNRVSNSIQRSKDISMKYSVFLGGIIVLLIAETGVLLFI